MDNLKISRVGAYSVYSAPIYDGFIRKNEYITMSDGVRIAAVYYIPTKGGEMPSEPLPAILHYTPYDRLSLASESAAERYARTMSDLSNVVIHEAEDGLVINGSYTDDDFGFLTLVPYGYVVLIADVRGTGASFGTRYYVNSPREAQDAAELVEWLAAQSFCSGKVGSCGYSYTGQTQMKLLTQRPKHLAAAFIGMTDYNKYDGWVRGGIPRAYGTSPDLDWGKTEEEINATVERIASLTVPVDGDEDRVLLRQAIREHVGEGSQCDMLEFGVYRDSGCRECPDKMWYKISPSTYADDINACNAAVYLMGGVYDCFRRDTFIIYENVKLQKKLTFGPWYHMSEKKNPDWSVEMLRWFDYWLRGIQNGIMDEEPITFPVCEYDFEKASVCEPSLLDWQHKGAWPLHSGSRKHFYPAAGGGLSETPVTAEERDYTAVYGVATSVESGAMSGVGSGAGDVGLVYTGEALERDLGIIGHPIVTLSFELVKAGWTKEKPDVDFFVSLCDYDPETGRDFQITEGRLRASMRRESGGCPYDFIGLPWFENLAGSDEYLEEGGSYDLRFDMLPTFYRVKAGHSLRLVVTNSSDRTYYHGRRVFENDPDCEKPVVRLHLGEKTAVELPDIYE